MDKKKKSYIFFASVIVLGVVIDLLTKIIFEKYFIGGEKEIVVIPNFFSFTYVKNTGAAFGIFGESTWALSIASVFFIGVFVTYDIFYHSDNLWYVFGISMLISGAIGNLIDRIFLGYVRDFINIEIFPFVFNFADALITFGVICFGVFLVFFGYKDGKRENKDGKNQGSEEIESQNKNDDDFLREKKLETNNAIGYDANLDDGMQDVAKIKGESEKTPSTSPIGNEKVPTKKKETIGNAKQNKSNKPVASKMTTKTKNSNAGNKATASKKPTKTKTTTATKKSIATNKSSVGKTSSSSKRTTSKKSTSATNVTKTNSARNVKTNSMEIGNQGER